MIRVVPPTSGLFTMRQSCAVNALCELDRPGEWYLDVAQNRVFYWPPEGFDPEQCVLSTFNTASSAIRLEACDALVELNYFRRCVYESGDQGAIDMWGNPLYRGNIIRWNDFDSIIASDMHRGAAAIRHDDFISGFMVTENVIRKGSGWGAFGAVQFNQGTDSYVEGNVIVDWHKAFSGGSAADDRWAEVITKHSNSKKMLAETDWKSEAWQKKYPMVRDLLNGTDNRNYLVGNLQLGTGDRGGVGRAINLGNRTGSKDVQGATLAELQPHLVPWYPIPVELIGPYSE